MTMLGFDVVVLGGIVGPKRTVVVLGSSVNQLMVAVEAMTSDEVTSVIRGDWVSGVSFSHAWLTAMVRLMSFGTMVFVIQEYLGCKVLVSSTQ